MSLTLRAATTDGVLPRDDLRTVPPLEECELVDDAELESTPVDPGLVFCHIATGCVVEFV